MAGNALLRRRKLRSYVAVLFRWGWLVLLCGVIGAGSAYGVSKSQPPIYRASTLLMVNAGSAGTTDTYTSLLASDQLVQTDLHLITTTPVLQRAAQQVGGITAIQLATRVRVANPGISTPLLQVQVDDPSPIRAAQLANAIAGAFIAVQQQTAAQTAQDASQQLDQQIAAETAQISNLNSQIAANPNDASVSTLKAQVGVAEQQQQALKAARSLLAKQPVVGVSNVQVFEAAVPPTKPDHPVPRLYAEVGGLAGLLLAAAVVILLEVLDDRMRTSSDVEQATGLLPLGTLTTQRKDGVLLTGKSSGVLAESFRMVLTNLGFATLDQPLSTLVVTSAMAGEGKTTIAINLALSLAASGKRVLLLDADLRHPAIHERLGLDNVDGLTVQLQERDYDEEAQRSLATLPGIPNLWVVPAGPLPPNPTAIVGSARLQRFLETILPSDTRPGLVDVVVIDTPPVASVADAAVLAARASATLVVVNAKRCRAGRLLRAYGALSRANAHLVGFVLNQVTPVDEDTYYTDAYYTNEVARHHGALPIPDLSSGSIQTDQGRVSERISSGFPRGVAEPSD